MALGAAVNEHDRDCRVATLLKRLDVALVRLEVRADTVAKLVVEGNHG